MEDEGYVQVVKHDGRAYIAIDTMIDVLNMMVAVRNQYVENNPDAVVLVPGSDHAAHFINDILEQVRYNFFAGDDLTSEVSQMMGDINDFLSEQ